MQPTPNVLGSFEDHLGVVGLVRMDRYSAIGGNDIMSSSGLSGSSSSPTRTLDTRLPSGSSTNPSRAQDVDRCQCRGGRARMEGYLGNRIWRVTNVLP